MAIVTAIETAALVDPALWTVRRVIAVIVIPRLTFRVSRTFLDRRTAVNLQHPLRHRSGLHVIWVARPDVPA